MQAARKWQHAPLQPLRGALRYGGGGHTRRPPDRHTTSPTDAPSRSCGLSTSARRTFCASAGSAEQAAEPLSSATESVRAVAADASRASGFAPPPGSPALRASLAADWQGRALVTAPREWDLKQLVLHGAALGGGCRAATAALPWAAGEQEEASMFEVWKVLLLHRGMRGEQQALLYSICQCK